MQNRQKTGQRLNWKQLAGVIGALAAALLLWGGCQQARMAPPAASWSSDTPGVLAAGDVINLSFPGAPTLNGIQKIRADGRVVLPLIGETQAAGKTLADFQGELVRAYESELQHKEVVLALEATAASVYVSGAVRNPGRVPLERPMTILEAVMEAGGFELGRANPGKVTLVRHEEGRHYTHVIDMRPLLRGQESGAFPVRAYDVIYVPERLF